MLTRLPAAVLAAAVTLAMTAAPSSAATTISVLAQPIAQSSLTELIASYEKAHPDVTVHVDYAASNTTLAQVENGRRSISSFCPTRW